MTPTRIALLGSTGSIGVQALEVVRANRDRLDVVALAAGRDWETVAAQAEEFDVRDLGLADAGAAQRLREAMPQTRVRDGVDGISELARHPDTDVVLNAITGAQGLRPTLSALETGHRVALANKESLVVGGSLVLAAAAGRPDAIVPVDSEHSALAQCLRGGRRDEVARLVLTASGGPFRGRSRAELAEVSVDDALAHPTWEMGPVITVNSATLMNKGLELIEANLLFGVPWSALDVVVHPQSIVHSMVEFTDGSTLAQLSPPDMRLPIQLALSWPQRFPNAFTAMDWTRTETLTFEAVDRTAFPALDLAEDAGRRGGAYPAVLNAANEEAVDAFLGRRIGFTMVTDVVAEVLAEHEDDGTIRDLETLIAIDGWARARATEVIADVPRRTSD